MTKDSVVQRRPFRETGVWLWREVQINMGGGWAGKRLVLEKSATEHLMHGVSVA